MGAVLEETVFEEDLDQLPAPDGRQIIAEIITARFLDLGLNEDAAPEAMKLADAIVAALGVGR
jgi:hypothetical protein